MFYEIHMNHILWEFFDEILTRIPGFTLIITLIAFLVYHTRRVEPGRAGVGFHQECDGVFYRTDCISSLFQESQPNICNTLPSAVKGPQAFVITSIREVGRT